MIRLYFFLKVLEMIFRAIFGIIRFVFGAILTVLRLIWEGFENLFEVFENQSTSFRHDFVRWLRIGIAFCLLTGIVVLFTLFRSGYFA